MKRLACLMMALTIFFSLFLMGSPAVYAEDGETNQEIVDNTQNNTPEPTPESSPESTPEATPEPTPEPTQDPSIPSGGPFTFSKSGLSFIKTFEGFLLYPKWDYAQWTVGYGTRCPDDKLAYYKEHGISREEAEDLLSKEIASFSYEVNKFISKNSLKLTQNQFDALVSFSYNVGTAWLYDRTVMMWQAVVNGYSGNDFIRAIGRWSLAGGEVLTGLLRRRLAEANMYLNGIYSTSVPANYCYVLYDANGGMVAPKSQCYDANDPAQIVVTKVEQDGKSFVGWFTAKVGGEEVTVLDASLRNKTIYARWASGGVVEDGKLEKPVTVTVTGYSVYLRNGPGTNYGVVGSTWTGETFVITHAVKGGDYLWGMSGDKWIALEFTNYAEVAQPEPPVTEPPVTEPPVTEPPVTEPPVTEPPVTEPPVTEPPVTEPPVTEPPVTEPPVTEPPVTEPPVTEPPVTEPPVDDQPVANKVMGTVNAPAGLMIRTGPGTGYSSVGALLNGSRVEILEQKTVGAMTWGRIERGWISLTYVELDRIIKPEGEKVILTGRVNCYCLIVRKGAGSSNGIADYLYQGDRVEVFEKKTVSGTVWGRIANGWVSLDFITVDKEASSNPSVPPVTNPPVTNPPVTNPPATNPPVTNPPETEPPVTDKPAANKVMGTVNASGGLMIRSGPGTSYGSVGALVNGSRVEILEQKTVGSMTWGRITKGWICLDFVKLDKETTPSPVPPVTEPEPPVTQPQPPVDDEPATNKVTGTVNASGGLMIRKGPGTSNAIVGSYYNGAKVTILEQTTVGGVTWGRTDKGWISLSFVVLNSNSGTSQKVYRTVDCSCLIVRKGAGTSYGIASYLYYGTKVEVLEQKTVFGATWGRISSGWICLDFTK